MKELLYEISRNGLKIGENWVIYQNGNDLWVSNLNQTAQNETAGAVSNETLPGESPQGNMTVPQNETAEVATS